MKHPFEKYIKLEIVTLGGAIIFSLVALFKGYFLLAVISFYLIAISLVCDALIKWQYANRLEAGKQLIRALILFLLATYLLLRSNFSL